MYVMKGGVCLPVWRSPVLVAALAFLYYAPSWDGYFVSDDYEFLGRVSFTEAARYWTRSWGYGNEYRPLLVYTYALDAVSSGSSPAGYHVVNTALHVANGLLLMWVAARCGAERWVALLAAVLFLLNPVSHESVLWISGRPVLLSALFLLASVAALLRVLERDAWRWHLALSLCLCLGLLSYEGAAVIPIVLLLVGLYTSHRREDVVRSCLVPLMILVAYAVFWNNLFSGRIQRFPTETSIAGTLDSLFEAFRHSFHGISRPVLAPIYAAVLGPLLTDRAGRRFVAACASLFVAAYLPFFIVRGFADRFAYASSLVAALLLAAALGRIFRRHSRRAAVLLALCLAGFFGVGMRNRMEMWREAGEIARRIPAEIKVLRPALPAEATLVVLNVPDMHKHALVYLTGLERALALQYPGLNIRVRRHAGSWGERPTFVFRYRGCHVRQVTSNGWTHASSAARRCWKECARPGNRSSSPVLDNRSPKWFLHPSRNRQSADSARSPGPQ